MNFLRSFPFTPLPYFIFFGLCAYRTVCFRQRSLFIAVLWTVGPCYRFTYFERIYLAIIYEVRMYRQINQTKYALSKLQL